MEIIKKIFYFFAPRFYSAPPPAEITTEQQIEYADCAKFSFASRGEQPLQDPHAKARDAFEQQAVRSEKLRF